MTRAPTSSLPKIEIKKKKRFLFDNTYHMFHYSFSFSFKILYLQCRINKNYVTNILTKKENFFMHFYTECVNGIEE